LTLEGGVVPPVLTRNKPSSNVNLLRFAMLLGVVVVAAVVVIKFYPYFITALTTDSKSVSTETAIRTGEGRDKQTETPASHPAGSGVSVIKTEAAAPVVKEDTQDGSAVPPEASKDETVAATVPQTALPGTGQDDTARDLQTVSTLTDNKSVMTAVPQALKEEKIKIVTSESVGERAGQVVPQSQAVDAVPPFPEGESFLGGYEGDYAPSAVVVTSKKVGTGEQKSSSQPNQSSRNLKSEQFFQLGLSAQKSGHFSEAEGYYLEGLKRDASNVGMMANLSAVYLEQHKYQEAESVLAKARKISPQNSKLLVNLGLLELGRNQNAKAKHWFSEAARINPYDLDALNNLAYLAQQENDLAGMETYYQRMVNLSPNNQEVLLTYASLLERSNKFQEAIVVYQKAMDMPGIKNSPSMKGEIRKRIRILSQY